MTNNKIDTAKENRMYFLKSRLIAGWIGLLLAVVVSFGATTLVNYDFEDNALDLSGNGNNGTVTGTVSYVAGHSGKALSLSGSGYINLPQRLIYNNPKFTISMWFKTSSSGGLIGYENTGVGTTPTEYVPILSVQQDGKLYAEMWTGASMTVTSAGVVNDNQWHRVVMSVSTTAIRVYLDGVDIGGANGTPVNLHMYLNQLGTNAGWGRPSQPAIPGQWNYFNGLIDEFSFFSDAQSAQEIAKTTQTITFNSITDKFVGNSSFEITASSTSGLPVTFTSATPSVCTVSGNTVIIVGPGTAIINANQAGDATYSVAPQVIQSFVVRPYPQHLSQPVPLPLSMRSATVQFLKSDSTLWSWGLNNFKQSDSSSTSPITAPKYQGTRHWRMVVSGFHHTDAIAADSTLWTWGRNDSYGKLGLGIATDITQAEPAQIGNDKWIKVATMFNHVMAIRSDSTLWGWGDNSYGQLGDGTTISSNMPIQIGTDKWVAVSVGNYHTLAIRSDMTLWAWGQGYYGRIGDGDGSSGDRTSPVQIGNSLWIGISAGGDHSMAIRYDSTLWTWGRNQYKALGDGTTTDRIAPVQIGTSKWIAISGGGSHSLGIKADSSLWTWGRNLDGTVGDGNGGVNMTNDVGTPYNVLPGTKWRAAVAGAANTIGIKNDGSVWSWGISFFGANGDGTSSDHYSPSGPINAELPKVVSVTPPADSLYKPGETLIFIVNMNKSVSVSGTPQLALTIGSSTTIATYISGSGTTTLTFNYVVQPNDIDLNGISASSPITLNSGSIRDGAGNNAVLTFTVPDLSNVKTGKTDQTITFNALPAKVLTDADFSPGAIASSGLEVTFSSDDTSVATIVNSKIHIAGAGSTVIRANQAGNDFYNVASEMTQVLTVTKSNQAITFSSLAAKTYGDTDFTPGATASSVLQLFTVVTVHR